MHPQGQGSRQSCFIRSHLCCKFGVTLDPGCAINRKMVLVKFVQDRKMNLFRYGTGETKQIEQAVSNIYDLIKLRNCCYCSKKSRNTRRFLLEISQPNLIFWPVIQWYYVHWKCTWFFTEKKKERKQPNFPLAKSKVYIASLNKPQWTKSLRHK